MSEPIVNSKQLEIDDCRENITQALNLMKMGRRLDAQDLLEASITHLENLGVVDDCVQTKSLLADLLDDMGYYKDAGEHRTQCIDLAASRYGRTSKVRADLLMKQAETLFKLIDQTEENGKVVKYCLDLCKIIQEALEVIEVIPEYCNREDLKRGLKQKLLFCQLLVDKIKETEEYVRRLKSV